MSQPLVGLLTRPCIGGYRHLPKYSLRSPYRASKGRQPVICSSGLAANPQAVFNTITFCVMPLYAMMTALPNQKLTRKVVSSPWLYTAASLLYVTTLFVWGRQGILQLMWSATKQYICTWEVEKVATLFQDPMITALTWTHLLLLDLFVARHIYLDGLQRKVATAHSVILCFMFGPTGLLSHMLTKSLVSRHQQPRTSPA